MMLDNSTSGGLHLVNVTEELPVTYATILYGHVMPVLLLITVVANTLVVLVLSQPHMRTPTNLCLLAMALCDLLTLLSPSPWLLYMYTLGNHYKPLYPASVCYVWHAMNEVIPNLFHTASIWLTLVLAAQRYVYVCRASEATIWCTVPKVFKTICWITFLAFIHQATRFFDRRYVDITIDWRGKISPACSVEFSTFVLNVIPANVYYLCYFGFRVLFVHALPCISLVALNVLLFRAMKSAEVTRERLVKERSRRKECRRLRDANLTTCMLIVVVSVVLVVEIPLAVLTVLHIVSSVSAVPVLDYDVANVLVLFTNFFIVASYPVNFAVYCGMSRHFRETFRNLFVNRNYDAPNNGFKLIRTGMPSVTLIPRNAISRSTNYSPILSERK